MISFHESKTRVVDKCGMRGDVTRYALLYLFGLGKIRCPVVIGPSVRPCVRTFVRPVRKKWLSPFNSTYVSYITKLARTVHFDMIY